MAGLVGIALRGFGKALLPKALKAVKRSKLGKTIRRTFGNPKKTPQYKDESTGKMLRRLPPGNYKTGGGRRIRVDSKGKIFHKD
tara:strand:+ start:284 stop:535 length:252 start_codon:yes stop_codon:yes gene_type:complete